MNWRPATRGGGSNRRSVQVRHRGGASRDLDVVEPYAKHCSPAIDDGYATLVPRPTVLSSTSVTLCQRVDTNSRHQATESAASTRATQRIWKPNRYRPDAQAEETPTVKSAPSSSAL